MSPRGDALYHSDKRTRFVWTVAGKRISDEFTTADSAYRWLAGDPQWQLDPRPQIETIRLPQEAKPHDQRRPGSAP